MGFVALGDTATALAAVGCTRGMEAVLPRVAEQVREAITAPRGRARPHCPEALQARPPACSFIGQGFNRCCCCSARV